MDIWPSQACPRRSCSFLKRPLDLTFETIISNSQHVRLSSESKTECPALSHPAEEMSKKRQLGACLPRVCLSNSRESRFRLKGFLSQV